MTENNKPVMIHNVDVSRCKFFTKDYKKDDVHLKNFCKLNFIHCGEFDCAKCDFKQLARKTEECEKWKSYYELYRINNDILKKVQGVINDSPKYGIELTENSIIDKDERLSCLEIHEQIKLIIDEQSKEIDRLQAENKGLKNINDVIKEHSRYYKREDKRYKKEIGKLKEQNEQYKKKFQEFFNTDNQECWNAAFLQGEKAKAERKLEQIKRIAKYSFNLSSIELIVKLEQILQIMDEVE